MWEITPSKWKQVYMDARGRLHSIGIEDLHTVFVLFGMMYVGLDYNSALRCYAEYRGEAPERLHSYLCGELLRSRLEIGPGELLTRLAGGGVKSEDGVSIAKGS